MGRDKALIRTDKITILELLVDVCRFVTEDVVLLGNPAFLLPPSVAALPVLADQLSGIGPMAGLETLLSARPQKSSILLACDMPYLCETLLRRLVAAEGEFDAAVCRTGGEAGDSASGVQWHPCCALYRPSALPVVSRAIVKQTYSMIGLLDRLRVKPIDLAGDEAKWVENWNMPEDVGGGSDC